LDQHFAFPEIMEATNDAAGAFLTALPVGSMGSGNHQAEIARLKRARQVTDVRRAGIAQEANSYRRPGL
jgi:hypothetical protein